MSRIDFHTHALPIPFRDRLETKIPPFKEVRKRAKQLTHVFTPQLHTLQTYVRHLPEGLRNTLDQWTGYVPLPGLLLESSVADLLESMRQNSISKAVLIAQPPRIPNEFILEAAQEHPELYPALSLPPDTAHPSEILQGVVLRGVRILKIHPAYDGEGPTSPHYRALLKLADDRGLVVILHTGCFHSTTYFKKPELGSAQLFAPWFETYSQVKFVLAHMNFHEPKIAMNLAQAYPNVYLDTSWQPAEAIWEATREVGAEKVLFGTDWPILGDTQRIGIKRIQDCVESGWLTEEQSQMILGKNAELLLN